MKVAVFILSFFTTLLCGSLLAVSGAAVNGNTQSVATSTTSATDAVFAHIPTFFDSINSLTESQYVNAEEFDEEDVSEVLAKKYKSHPGASTQQAFPIVSGFNQPAKSASVLWRKTSCRYILQRTLRV